MRNSKKSVAPYTSGAKPVPFVVLDYDQPNFLLPSSGSRHALDAIFSASLGPEFEADEEPSPDR